MPRGPLCLRRSPPSARHATRVAWGSGNHLLCLPTQLSGEVVRLRKGNQWQSGDLCRARRVIESQSKLSAWWETVAMDSNRRTSEK